jgi:hypothetical protein
VGAHLWLAASTLHPLPMLGGTRQRLSLSLPVAVVVPPADPKAHASLIPIQRCLVCAGAVGTSVGCFSQSLPL